VKEELFPGGENEAAPTVDAAKYFVLKFHLRMLPLERRLSGRDAQRLRIGRRNPSTARQTPRRHPKRLLRMTATPLFPSGARRTRGGVSADKTGSVHPPQTAPGLGPPHTVEARGYSVSFNAGGTMRSKSRLRLSPVGAELSRVTPG
jgi:hypothetical protein